MLNKVFNTYEKRVFVLLMSIVIVLQIVYMTDNPFDVILITLIDVIIFLTIWNVVFTNVTIYQNKPKTDFIQYGTSLNDALNGNKYRYDLIVDNLEKDKMM
jgi:hypothetical protein|uniref:Uncharacterized protein n=1 Tax=viral metagenome TaxID=1070528 RepID=A0A6C0BRZ3_9ZZZZ